MAENILVVEYEPRYVDRARQALSGQPFIPSFAKDGEEALRLLQVERPVLIVLSSVIPKVSAPDLIRAIRNERSLDATRILLTVAGYSGSAPKADAIRMGASDLLSKPFTEADFLTKVLQMLGSSEAGDAAAINPGHIVHATMPEPPQGGGVTSDDLFGDLTDAAQDAAPAPKQRSSADVDKLVADTLAGLMTQKKAARPSPSGEAKPKTHSGTSEIDRIVHDTLSGLEKSARAKTSGGSVPVPSTPPAAAAAPQARSTPAAVASPDSDSVENDNVASSQPIISAAAAAPAVAPPAPVPEEEEPLDGIRFGQYVLLEKIATGGMAEVWKARMRGVEGFQKIVAIKKILPHLSDNEEFIAMFVDEAKLAAQLSHNNIIHIYDLGKVQDSYYIAMEYVDGYDLKTILKRAEEHGLPVTVELALFVASKIAAALDYAHRKRDFEDHELGLVHRDVSPQNVLISVEGDIKLCDFGIAKAASKASHTQNGALKGKLQYMSPEQAWGRAIDRRTDVFALATVLFELLTARKLFGGENEMSLLEQVREAQIVAPSEFNDEVPPEVDAIVMKALEREPDRRYQTAGEMAREIDRILYSLRPTPTAADLAIYMHHLAEPLPSQVRPAAAVEPEPVPVVEEKPLAPIAHREEPAPIRRSAPVAVPSAEHAIPSMFAPPAEKKKSPVVPIAIAAVVLIAAAAAFFMMRGKAPAESTPAAVASAPGAATTAPAPVAPVADTQTGTAPVPAVPLTASAAQPAIDAAQVDAEVRKRLEAERARLQQAPAPVTAARQPVNVPVARPAQPPAVVVPPPATETRAAAPVPQPAAPVEAPAPAPERAAPVQEAPRAREGDLVQPGTDGLTAARMTRRAMPVYPPMAKIQRVQGSVVLSVLVSERGEVLETRVISGVKRNVGLNEAAQQAIRKSAFAPGTKDGVRVKSWTTVEVDFKL